MHSFLSILFCLLFFLFQSLPGYAQNSSILKAPEAFNENLLWFDSIIGTENSGVVNAKIDYHVFKPSHGHKFFDVANWRAGQIKYDGQVYALSGIKYDIVNQYIVIKYLDQQYKLPVPLQIHSGKVEWFKVSAHYFQKIPFIDSALNENTDGFYHILYQGNALSFISRRKKDINEIIVDRKVVSEYQIKDQFFLLRNEDIFTIKRKRDYYQLIPDKKKEIKQYIRKNNLRINRENEEALIMLTKFCESLVN